MLSTGQWRIAVFCAVSTFLVSYCVAQSTESVDAQPRPSQEAKVPADITTYLAGPFISNIDVVLFLFLSPSRTQWLGW